MNPDACCKGARYTNGRSTCGTMTLSWRFMWFWIHHFTGPVRDSGTDTKEPTKEQGRTRVFLWKGFCELVAVLAPKRTMLLTLLDLALVIFACGASLVLFLKRRKSTIPGPSGIPFFGNIFQIPSDQQWLLFNEWSSTYGALFRFHTWSKHQYWSSIVPGELVQITILGKPTLVLGTHRVANDLLESRGSNHAILTLSCTNNPSLGLIYSDRPTAIMAGEL